MSESYRSPTRRPITDSPWFWVLLFSAAGTVCLVIIAPQYRPRQRRLEMQYMAREEMFRRQAEGEPVARETGQEGDAAPPTANELMIPLWPLVGLCVLLMFTSSYLLWRDRAGHGEFPDPPASRGAP